MGPKADSAMCWLACRDSRTLSTSGVRMPLRDGCVFVSALLGILWDPRGVSLWSGTVVRLLLPCRGTGVGHMLCPFWKLPNTYIALSLLSFPLGLCCAAVLQGKSTSSFLLFGCKLLKPLKEIALSCSSLITIAQHTRNHWLTQCKIPSTGAQGLVPTCSVYGPS